MITAVTQNSPESLLAFRNFEFRRSVRSMIAPLVVLFVTGIAFLFFVPTFGAILISVTVLALPVYALTKWMRDKSAVKRSGAFFRTANKYEFGETSLRVTSASAGQKKAVCSEMPYRDLYRIYETDGAFYLYLKPKSCLLCPKQDFTEGTAEECSALLKRTLAPGTFVRVKGGRHAKVADK